MDLRDYPSVNRGSIRQCVKCGCDLFRFKRGIKDNFQQEECRNCGHIFIDHTTYVRKQAE